MKKTFLTASACALFLPLTAFAQSAHVHGAGELNVAIDGNNALVELHIPANDVVGFENAPSDSSQQAAVDAALAELGDGGLFWFSAGAQCSSSSADAEFEVEGDHAEFHIEYGYGCADGSAINSISTFIFELYVGVEELEANVVTASGASAYEWNSENATLSLN